MLAIYYTQMVYIYTCTIDCKTCMFFVKEKLAKCVYTFLSQSTHNLYICIFFIHISGILHSNIIPKYLTLVFFPLIFLY